MKMFIQIRKWTVTEGNADKIIERFNEVPKEFPFLKRVQGIAQR
jgi:heme oxygenase (staphylobilin-producing)